MPTHSNQKLEEIIENMSIPLLKQEQSHVTLKPSYSKSNNPKTVKDERFYRNPKLITSKPQVTKVPQVRSHHLDVLSSRRPSWLTRGKRLDEFSLRRERPLPPIVIQKFDADPMNYWLFVRQFETYVLGKIKDYELFLLLYQNCEPSVQSKISHLSSDTCNRI